MCQRCLQSNELMNPEGCNPTEVDRGGPVDALKPHGVGAEQSLQNGSPLASRTPSLTSSDSIGSSCGDSSDIIGDGGDGPHDGRNGNDQDEVPEEPTGEGESEVPYPFEDFWAPPEAENKEDDKENSVVASAVYDDDDECDDGMKWGSSLSGFEDGENRSDRYKEEKEMAMEEVKNGKFRSLVSRLLLKAGIIISDNESESWVDIISSLAWKAASFVKPDATKGRAMDPAGYVKVKCVASGAPSESRLIKGLVFKKHAAHKHMQTKHKNPRLLLVRGMLGQSSGLSSFNSMIHQGQATDKPLIDNLEACRPDVVLVEKSVSRDVLEGLLDKGITLVIDMKLHRLERVAQCTGSSIVSADMILGQKLKQCDSLYFEKFEEEHEESEGGKKPRKTLMFLEGCPTRLGCTILLRGSRVQELKTIKYVMQCAVVMAYHFILETSFLLDQEAMFCTVGTTRVASIRDEVYSRMSSVNSNASIDSGTSVEDASAEKSDIDGFNKALCSYKKSTESSIIISSTSKSVPLNEINVPIAGHILEQNPEVGGPALLASASSQAADIPTSDGLVEGKSQHMCSQWEDKSVAFNQPSRPTNLSELSSISASIEEVVKKDLPTAYPSMRHLCLGERVSVAKEPSQSGTEVECHSNEQKLVDASNNYPPLPSNIDPATDVKKEVDEDHEGDHKKDDISTALDSESILVLTSSRNAKRGTICEQSHLSHIKFYKNFDVPLGEFLRDNLLNQNLPCKTCNEQPEAHFYYYAHHNKQLTIQVKQIPDGGRLPGESEGKLWMWSRCGKCKPVKDDNKKCTKRVLISSVARGLSFGKFLELSFSNHSSFNRLSNCGHSLHRDFLYFFGLGQMVSMFRYSPVVTYSVSVPPQKLEFSSIIKREWLQEETESVYTKAMLLFAEIANYLKKIEPRLSGLALNISVSIKEFHNIEKMLALERHEFEENIKNTCITNKATVRKLLCLNRLRWELLLEAYIWNRRLQLLLSSGSMASYAPVCNTVLPEEANVGSDSSDLNDSEATMHETNSTQIASITMDHGPNNLANVEVPIGSIPGPESHTLDGISYEPQLEPENASMKAENIESEISENPVSLTSLQNASEQKDLLSCDDNSQTGNITISNHPLKDRNILITKGLEDAAADSDRKPLDKGAPQLLPNTESSKVKWIWNSFSEIREECMKDLRRRGSCPCFQDSLRLDLPHSPDCLPNMSLIMSEEGSRMHIPLSNEDYIVSDYEDEISSIVASALSLMQDSPHMTANIGIDDKSQTEDTFTDSEESISVHRAISEPHSLRSLSINYQETDLIQTAPSMSSFLSHLSSFDGLNLLDSLVSIGAPHRAVSLGTEKYPGKGKYTVVCIYADKFHELRARCCPSELDYIASLCRCKIWDAKGGKSKSSFAKTHDDRLIIKEIKKTELEAFLKFAPEYFHHMQQSVDSGNQTCLAKILGIYQVTVRQPKTGKETKHDLMVMENLLFGRSISRQYDLKGALHARFTATADGSGDVLLDQNFVMDMNNSPLYIGQRAKRLLQRAIWNDTTFLTNINVMDYSLLVGVDTQKRELVCGIIDYLRQYTWDKQLETWVKSSLVPKNVLPTIISPKEYKRRFRKFMDTHFMTVPDRWCSQRSTPCKLCGIEGGGENFSSSTSYTSSTTSSSSSSFSSSSTSSSSFSSPTTSVPLAKPIPGELRSSSFDAGNV